MSARLMAHLTALGLAVQTFAAVSVTNVTCRQRYPWNGLVDIDYTIVSDSSSADIYVLVEGYDAAKGEPLAMVTLSGASVRGPVSPGKYRLTWDAGKDRPNFRTQDFRVKITPFRGAPPYIVVGLSNGNTAENYPVRYSMTGPDLSDDTCRTTELWLRLILPGAFMMGSPETELGRTGGNREKLHKVTLTHAFYIGVFELTQKQWESVSDIPVQEFYTQDTWNRDGKRPMGWINYSLLRGDEMGKGWPTNRHVDANSFIGRLRARSRLTFDLPTSAQWEYACRAGTTSALYSGKELTSTNICPNVSELGRYAGNRNDGVGGLGEFAIVGSYLPNAWGLYDMLGNVGEKCLDRFSNPTGEDLIDPKGGDGSVYSFVHKGGTRVHGPSNCRAAYRVGYSWIQQWPDMGCRLVVIPPGVE